MSAILVLALIGLTRPDGMMVAVNPDAIVSLTPPRDHGHFAPRVHCIVHTLDRKLLSVQETCQKIHRSIEKRR
jgi:hypothetical protein